MLSEQQGRTVLVSDSGSAPSTNLQVGVAYCHNVMPTAYGMNSVGYTSVIPVNALIPSGRTVTDARVIFGDLRSRIYLSWDSQGSVYALLEGASAWIAVAATSPTTGGSGFDINSVTSPTVNGVSYIMYSTVAAFTYAEASNTLVQAVLTGLTIGAILGLTSSNGYLVAYTTEAVAWSSTILPTDFVPSQITGAGGGNIAEIQGDILFCTSNDLGLLIYSKANVVSGVYSGNIQYPFKFKEVTASKGGISLDLVAYEANSAQQFVFSKGGLQAINSQKAELLLPSVTDFLAGKRFEDFDEVTKEYVVTDLAPTATMLKKVKYISSRYLMVSYGLTSFTHVLVWDIALQKAGKLKINHVDIFEYVGNQSEIARESVAFLLPTGEIKVLDFSVVSESSGVLILGKVQYSFTRMTNLLGVELENIQNTAALSVTAQASLDGKTFSNVEGSLAMSASQVRDYAFCNTAKNFSLVFIGKFDFVSVLVTYALAGRR
jgi:hypothetical protein